jgi:hypothetical protein
MSVIYEPLKKREELKEEAKFLLKGKWVEGSVFAFIVTVLLGLGGSFTNIFSLFENGFAFGMLLSLAFSILLGNVFTVALLKYFKGISESQHVTFSEIKKPFSYYSEVIILTVISFLIVLILFALAFVIAFTMNGTYLAGLLTTVLNLALIPLSLILETWMYFCMLDLNEAPLKEVFARSFFLVKKSWFQFLVLSLSFLGWYIVGILACGIGMYVVMPYHCTALALFHKNLKAHYFGTEIPEDDTFIIQDYPENDEYTEEN